MVIFKYVKHYVNVLKNSNVTVHQHNTRYAKNSAIFRESRYFCEGHRYFEKLPGNIKKELNNKCFLGKVRDHLTNLVIYNINEYISP